ncbi:hypothetical protein V496_06333 [Pseudogymnoascus sp. VKM F-4515 (FW-2607)]|nr:hypothetical protein V496_06333 [Pseudogymnoascus sp. VKM F-4515 (FW-2607)]KFY92218.1 hypothetical protein V498_05105 [Pseudogymnoascus sp. VKM F-4517 (FW-2822)]
MHNSPQEDPRDRRRRQNRESQRRWRERYRQTKPDDAKKPKGTPSGADEAPLATIPPISDLQSRPQSNHSLELPDYNDYFVQYTNWIQDQPRGQADTDVYWPPMDVDFHLQQGERCTSTYSQNDGLPREHSSHGYLNRVDEAMIQVSPESFASSQIRGQLSHFPSVGTCQPALVTPPASSGSAVIGAVYQPANSSGRREVESASTAVDTIRDVELLYSIGVKAGFLKPDDKVRYYLAAMKRIYHKAPTLMDEDDEELNGSDLDEWGDGALSDGGKLALPPLQY